MLTDSVNMEHMKNAIVYHYLSKKNLFIDNKTK